MIFLMMLTRSSLRNYCFSLYQGFVDVDTKLVCYTDHQIFERYHKFKLKNGYAKKQAIHSQELNKLRNWRLCDTYGSWNWKIWWSTKN